MNWDTFHVSTHNGEVPEEICRDKLQGGACNSTFAWFFLAPDGVGFTHLGIIGHFAKADLPNVFPVSRNPICHISFLCFR